MQGPSRKDLPEQVITRPEELPACCEHLRACSHFGFDTEFVGEDTYHPSLCLLQVATDEQLFLIDPLTVGPLEAFWNVVIDPAHTVIVHAGREEVRLCHLGSGKPPGNLFDLQIAAGLCGYNFPLGHGTLVSQVLGVQLSKGETLTEWRTRPLTKAQIRYAFDDVRYLLPAYRKIHKRLEKHQRLDWACEEFAQLARVATPSVTGIAASADKWRKLRGLGSLDRRRLALVREVFTWREEQAARLNRPARTIVRDDLLVEIAKRNPRAEKDLQVIRGLARRDLDAILQAVQRGRDVPLETCPQVAERDQDPPRVGLVVNVLMAALGDFCARERLAQSLVASTTDIKALVRSKLQGVGPSAESGLTHGWRAQHVLPEMLAVLDGKRALYVRDVRDDAPFGYSDRAD